MKKFIALALSLIMLLSLTACTISIGTNTDTDNTDTGGENTDQGGNNEGNGGENTGNEGNGGENTGNEGNGGENTGNEGNGGENTGNGGSGETEDEAMETVVAFINEASVYLAEATDGLINITVGAGGTIDLVFNFPNSNVVEASPIISGKVAPLSSNGGIKLLADEKEEGKEDSSNGSTPVIKNYTTPNELESYVVLNSINNKIKQFIGETEYFTAADFPFMEDMFGDLIGQVKFKSIFVDLIESKDEYTTQDGEFLTKVTPIIRTEEIDGEKIETVVGNTISGYKYSNGVLETYLKAVDTEGNLTQDTVYNTYELNGDNFFYESYILNDSGEKVVKDMINIIKVATEIEGVAEYYVQTIFDERIGGNCALTATATVPFDEAYAIEEKWIEYLNRAYDEGDYEAIAKIPMQVYVEASFREEPDVTHYKVQYFRNYNRDTTGIEETGTYPESWKNGFDQANIFNLEKYVVHPQDGKTSQSEIEALVMQMNGEFENSGYTEYVPFALKEYSQMLIPNITDMEKAYRIIVWGNDYTGITFESSDESVVTVTDDGYILTHDEGGAVITVKRGKLVLYFEVTVMSTIVSNIGEITLMEGTEHIYSVNPNMVEVIYESTNPEVAIYDEETLMIKALSVGKTTIISTAVATGEVIECEVTVVPSANFDFTLNGLPGAVNNVILGVPVIATTNPLSVNDTLGVHLTSNLPQDSFVYSYESEGVELTYIEGEIDSYNFTFQETGTYLIEVKYWLDSQTPITMLQITVVVE